MRIFTSLVVLASVTVATALGAAACSSSTSESNSEGCASNPFTCGSGTTCSVKDSTRAFGCIASGGGAKGSPCVNTAGMTACGDGLVCLQVTQSGGQCTSFCDATHVCATGETCAAAQLAGTSNVFHVCAGGAAPAPDAGSHDAAAE